VYGSLVGTSIECSSDAVHGNWWITNQPLNHCPCGVNDSILKKKYRISIAICRFPYSYRAESDELRLYAGLTYSWETTRTGRGKIVAASAEHKIPSELSASQSLLNQASLQSAGHTFFAKPSQLIFECQMTTQRDSSNICNSNPSWWSWSNTPYLQLTGAASSLGMDCVTGL